MASLQWNGLVSILDILLVSRHTVYYFFIVIISQAVIHALVSNNSHGNQTSDTEQQIMI